MWKVFENITCLLIIGSFSFISDANGDVYLTGAAASTESEFVDFINQHLGNELSVDFYTVYNIQHRMDTN